MWNSIIAFKNSVINKFGRVLGYAILIFGGFIALSFIGALIRIVSHLAAGLLFATIIFLGFYKLFELLGRR